jgi:Family of unknown function (DUF6288)/Putative Ig domain
MRLPLCFRPLILATTLASVFVPPSAEATVHPDLTQASVINQVKNNQIPGLTPYQSTYNLGATGLRGWMYRGDNNIPMSNSNLQGLATVWSRQILVTVATAPCGTAATFLPGDLIVGAMEGTSGSIPFFSTDARKALGAAITKAEVTGNLMLKRIRNGGYADVYVQIGKMGTYAETAPYSCPKSDTILNLATARLVKELIDVRDNSPYPNEFFNGGEGVPGPIKALALMAAVKPSNPNYTDVQTALKSFADSITPANLVVNWNVPYPTWRYAYMNIFLSEYYLQTVESNTASASILAGLNKYSIALAKAQGRYGTFGHGASDLTASGALHGTVPPYGSLNASSLAANLSLVLGKKALQAGGQSVDSEITNAIGRANNFYSYYVNKGAIPYGEHEPAVDSHSLNGKGQTCALFFALQGNRPTEAKYFSRVATASYHGREEGHTGTGLNFLWEGMGSNVAGAAAVAKYVEKIRWNLDLERRTDGSFVYDGIQNASDEVSTTGDGSYLGLSQWYRMNPTANYILTYSLPLKRLYITGKGSSASNEITTSELSDAIAAGNYIQACPGYSTATLIASLGMFDPVAREAAATQLADRALSTAQEASLIAQITNGTLSPVANRRVGVCTVLGLRTAKTGANVAAITTALVQRLSDTDLWVRAKAASALKKIPTVNATAQSTAMLTAFAANATDPEVINWTDPLQIANGFLSNTLFTNGLNSSYGVLSVNKPLFYSALRIGLKQPDSFPRTGVSNFSLANLTYQDANTLKSELIQCATSTSQADTMWSMYPRRDAITLLAKYEFPEGVAVATSMLPAPNGYTWNSPFYLYAALNALTSYGSTAASQLPALRNIATGWESSSSTMQLDLRQKIRATIAAIENPPLTYNFNSGTLQGWRNRVWNGGAWVDLAPNATTYAGTLLPASVNNNLFGLRDGGVGPVGGDIDAHLNTHWLRSPEFTLNGTGDLTVQLSKGISNTTNTPANQMSVPFAAINGGGWKGIALRRVSDGAFVITKAKTGYSAMEWFTTTITKAELATLNQTATYTLELINSDYGSWGWLMMDNVSIPGAAVTASPSALTYNFDDNSLQGWHNRVWNGSAWTDIAANTSTYAGTILPASGNNNLFGPLDGAVGPVGGSTDFHLNTLWLRSPEFYLNGSGNLTVGLSKGSSNTTVTPANQLSVPYAATNGGGWKGVALRRVSDGTFVLTKAKTGWTGPEYFTMTFTKAELATLNQTVAYTLELINSDYGSWGWLTMDNVSIPGTAALAYNFDNKTLQGWNNRVWNGSAWINLAANATTYAGTILPASSNNNLFGPFEGGAGPVGGNIDNHLNTHWLRSPEFLLNGSGDLTVQLAKGSSNTTNAPVNELSVPYAAIYGGGWKGVALRRASDGVFVLTKAKTGYTGMEYFTTTFSKAELASLSQSATYTLEVINSDYGGWGWLTVDNVAIPGVATGTATFRASSSVARALVESPPVFAANPMVVGGAKERFVYSGQTLAGRISNVADGDTVIYSKTSGPSWLTVARDGALSGTPPLGSAGMNSFGVQATGSGSLSASATLQIPVTGVPLLWSRANIGSGMLKGSVSYKKGTFSQSGSGSLGIKRDQLSYNYQTLTGDGEIKAMVSSLQNTGGQSDVGVMIRGSLAADSAYVFMGLSGSNTYRIESRLTTGGSATGATNGKGTLPNTWVKLARVGSVITAFKSSDGTTWTAVGSKNVELAATCYIGLGVSSGNNTSLNRSQFKNVSVTP